MIEQEQELELKIKSRDRVSRAVSVTPHELVDPKKERWSNLLRHWIRYSIVGMSSAAIELVLFFVLYQVLGFYVVAGNIIAITFATAYNFVMSRKWTFKSGSRLSRTLVLYLVLFVWNQLFSSWAIVGLMNFGLPTMLAKVLTMLCIVSWNFVLYRKVIFK